MSLGSWLKTAAWWAVGGPMVGSAKWLVDQFKRTSPPTPAGRVPQFSSYGRPLPIVYGKTRITGNVIYFKKNAFADKNSTAIALCEGPIAGITRVWKDQRVYEVNWTHGQIALSGFVSSVLRVGTRPTQDPWNGMPNLAYLVTYPGVCYVGYGNETQPETLVGYSFEVQGLLHGTGPLDGDAHPASVVQDFLTDTDYGCGIAASAVVTDVGQNGYASSSFRTYATAEGFYISPAITERRAAREHLRELLDCANADVVWSEGKIKVYPYGDVAVGSYVPTNTIRYALTNADFLDDENPVTVDIEPDTDRWNIWPVEFLERAPTPTWKATTDYTVGQRVRKGDNTYRCVTAGTSSTTGPSGTGTLIPDGTVEWDYAGAFDKAFAYNAAIAQSPEPVDVAQSGPRYAPTVRLHSICLRSAAQKISQIRAQRAVLSRATYTFRLGWRFCRLEPMDLVTITDSYLGLNARPVRVTAIEEDEEFNLTVTAEEWPFGIAGALEHPTQSSEGEVVWTDADMLALEPAARDGSNIPDNTIPGTKVADGSISVAKLVVGALKTSNYAEDGSGNPTAGAKLDHTGTALKVAPGNLQVGTRFIGSSSAVWSRGLVEMWDASSGPYIVRGGKNVASTATRISWGGNYGGPQYALEVTFPAGITDRLTNPVIHLSLTGRANSSGPESLAGITQVMPRVLGLHTTIGESWFDKMWIGFYNAGTGNWFDVNTVGDFDLAFSVLGDW